MSDFSGEDSDDEYNQRSKRVKRDEVIIFFLPYLHLYKIIHYVVYF